MFSIKGFKMTAIGLAMVMAMGTGSAAAGKQHKETKEEDLGIRKESIYDEEKVKPEHGEYIKAMPGKSKKMGRAFENSPALIPHDITGMLPIAETNNICMGCHMPEQARSMGATPVPKSHLTNLKTGEDLKGNLDLERYNCVQCHVPQMDINPPVKSTFKGQFRDRKAKMRSNLIEILDEGVSAD